MNQKELSELTDQEPLLWFVSHELSSKFENVHLLINHMI